MKINEQSATAAQDPSPPIEPFLIHQIAQSLFGDRYIVIYGNTVQFHSHCYHVEQIKDAHHPYFGYYCMIDANTTLAMWTDINFAPPGSYGAIFHPETGEIVGYDDALGKTGKTPTP